MTLRSSPGRSPRDDTHSLFQNMQACRKNNSGFVIGETLFLHENSKPFKGIKKTEFEKKWVKNDTYGDIYLPPFCSLIHRVRQELLIDPFNKFLEMAFPRLLTFDIAERFGLLNAWPYILLSVEEFRSGQEVLAIDKDSGKRILDPLQCAGAYAYLANKQFHKKELPVCFREELGGWTYRNEKRDSLRPVLRAVEFLRNEYIFLSTPQDVRFLRKMLIEAFCRYLDNYDLCYRITTGTGCFEIEENNLAEKLVKTDDIADIPVLDVELFLPENETWLEVLGASLWESQLTTSFKITGTDFTLESGCVGIGISRFCYAMLAQLGNQEYMP